MRAWQSLAPTPDQLASLMTDDRLTYTPAENAGRLDKPLALVHSEAAAIPEGARAFAAGATVEVDQHWFTGITQFDFYDRPDAVTRAADIVAAHVAR